MSKNIAISDALYRKLKRRKGRRSFSSTIEESLQSSGGIADVVGLGVLDDSTRKTAHEDFVKAGRRTTRRLEREAL